MIYDNILETIGNTPLVRINRLGHVGGATLWAKLESFNPGGSVKDRIGLSMIEAAEASGVLEPGMAIVEPTSGNTGIGLAMAAAVKGYRVILVMPETLSLERRAVMRALGAELVLVPADAGVGMTGAVKKADELAAENNWFQPRQFSNPANPDIHRRTTGEEILSDLDTRGEKVDAFVSGVGTGGTVSGVGEVLKSRYPSAQVVAVEPADSAVISGGEPGPHKIQGIGGGFIPENYNAEYVDRLVLVSNEEATLGARDLAKEEGIFCGISSGAIFHAAREVAKDLPEGSNVVFIVCDTGERYLSTELFSSGDGDGFF